MDDNCYLTFTAGFPVDKAKDRFVEKFGVNPRTWFIKKYLLWIGPNPKRKLKKTQVKNG